MSKSEERERRDPTREARELGARIAERINNEKEAIREDTFRDYDIRVGPGVSGEAIGVSLAAAEQFRDDGSLELEKHEGKEARTKCLIAICAKLRERGTPLPPNLQTILEVIMARVPGQWNQYDGDFEGVDLGKTEFDTATKTITIRFECFGSMVGKHIIRLALT